jgi:hypothetical protein
MWPLLRMAMFEGAEEGSIGRLAVRMFTNLDGADGKFCCLPLG